jgi:hypothetical protein
VPTRVAKGTAQATDTTASTLTLGSVTIATGRSVIVGLARNAPVGTVDFAASVTWNGNGLTVNRQESDIVDDSHSAEIWSLHNATGATGDVVATWSTPDPTASYAMWVIEVEGLQAASTLDKTGGNSNISPDSTPSVGPTLTTAVADEYLVGHVVTQGPPGDAAGSWTDSFSDGQRVGADGTLDITVSEGYRIVTSTGAYATGKTGITARQWIALIATYRAAQVSAPTVVDMTAAVDASTAVPGAVSSAPDVVDMVTASDASTGTPGLIAALAENAAMAAAIDEPSDTITSWANNAGVVTSLNPAMLRCSSPADMGDGSKATFAQHAFIGGGSPATPTLVVTGAAFDDMAEDRTISHVVLNAYGALAYNTGDQTITATRMKWTVGAQTATLGIAEPYKMGPEDTTAVGHRLLTSGNQATKPGGGAWTRADVNALVDMKVEVDMSLDALENATLRISEMWLEVYGPLGAQQDAVSLRQASGAARLTLQTPTTG